MIDFHTHILPGIDDGSHSTEMTKEMLRREAQMGVTHVYATPHFYAHRSNIGRFLEKTGLSRKIKHDEYETIDFNRL